MSKARKGTETTSTMKKTSPAKNPGVTADVSSVSTPRPALIFESLEQKIRVRAYELYLARGGSNGSPEGDWLRAEAEIRTKRSA